MKNRNPRRQGTNPQTSPTKCRHSGFVQSLILTELAGVEVQGKMLNPRPVQPGEVLSFRLSLDHCHLFDAETGNSLR